MRNFLAFFICINIFSAIPIFAQDQCAINLSEAEDKYELGRFYEIPEILESCISEGFSDEQKVRAYRLITLSWLYLNYFDKADSSYLKLLKISPEHETNEEVDPAEIINLHEKFTTKPIYYLTPMKIGINFSSANVLNDYSLSQSHNGSDNYSTALGFHIGFGAEMVIYNNLHLAGEFYITSRRVHLSDTHWDYYSTNMDIVHTEFELPIMLKYNFFKGKINPFISGGISPVFIAGSSMKNIEGSYIAQSGVDGEEGEENPLQIVSKISTTDMKNRFNYSLLLGAGINYKIGLNYLVFEARYSMGMYNVTDMEDRWREDFDEARDLKFTPGQVDDDFRLNNISLFVGFVWPIYKPRKIK